MRNTALFVLTMGSVFALGLSPAAAAKPQAVVFPIHKADGLRVKTADLETLWETRDHQRKGLAMVYVNIDPSGKVHGAEAKRGFSGTPTGACVAGVIKRLRFPASNKGARFMYPFLVK